MLLAFHTLCVYLHLLSPPTLFHFLSPSTSSSFSLSFSLPPSPLALSFSFLICSSWRGCSFIFIHVFQLPRQPGSVACCLVELSFLMLSVFQGKSSVRCGGVCLCMSASIDFIVTYTGFTQVDFLSFSIVQYHCS